MIAIKAGRLVDPDTGTELPNQVVLVSDGKITAVGGTSRFLPAPTDVIDLTNLTVLPGLVGAPRATRRTALQRCLPPGPGRPGRYPLSRDREGVLP